MDSGARRRFDDMAERDKVRFENDMRLFLSMPPPQPADSKQRRRRAKKDPNAPKRAL